MKRKAQYSEGEAALEVGVSVEEFRSLIRDHIVRHDEELGGVPLAAFNASEVLLLRHLAASGANSVAVFPSGVRERLGSVPRS